MIAWEIVTTVHKTLKKLAIIGAKLSDLDKVAEKIVLDNGGTCYNKGYKGGADWPKDQKPKKPFPNALVVNVNSCIVHGRPTDYILRNSDVVSFDIGVKKDGLCGDGGFTMGIGQIENKNARLMYYAKRALYIGIEQVKAGANVKDISRAIELYIIKNGYVVNERFGGHGIGKEMHEDPNVPNFTSSLFKDYILKEGQMICIEPIVTFKDISGMQVDDWAWVTRDGKASVFFEHQIRVEKNGATILTDHIDKDELFY